MSFTPDLDGLLKLTALIDRCAKADVSPDGLLAEALPALIDAVQADYARFYRVGEGAAFLQAATDRTPSSAPTRLETLPVYNQATRERAPVYARGAWIAPLHAGGPIFGFLEVGTSRQDTAYGGWLRLACQHLALALTTAGVGRSLLDEVNAARDSANHLVLASRLIMSAQTEVDMALAAMYTVAQPVTAVAITLFDRPLGLGDVPQWRRVVARVHADGALTADPAPRSDLMPFGEALNTLRRGLPLFPDVKLATGPTLQELKALDLRWMVSFGLRAGDLVLGTLDAFHTQDYTLSSEMVDAYAMLADQIGGAIRTRQLLEQTTAALEETRLLYNVNRAVLGAQDTAQVLAALRQHLAPSALILSHMKVTYDSHNRIQTLVLDWADLPIGSQPMSLALHEVLGEAQVSAVNVAWNGNQRVLKMVEDMDSADASDPMAEFSKNNGVRSYVSIAVRDKRLVREAITIGFAEPQQFDSATRRLYETMADQVSLVLRTHWLLHEAQESAAQMATKVRVLQTLNQLTEKTNTTANEKDLLDFVCQALYETVGPDHTTVGLLDPSDAYLNIISEYPRYGSVGMHLDIAVNPLHAQMQRGQPMPFRMDSVADDPRIPETLRSTLLSLKIRGLLIVPLFVMDKFIGSVGLDLYEGDKTFSDEMVEITQTIAAQTSTGLQNLRLLKDAQRRAEQLQAIASFSQSVQATLDLEAIFRAMLTASAGMLAQDQMSISLYDTETGLLRSVAEHADGVTDVDLNSRATIPISGQIAEVWKSWELLHIPDLHATGEWGASDNGIRSWILAPILARGRILGLVSVGSSIPYTYSETDVALFQQMVNQLAVAIENAEAYAQSQRMVRNESLVNEISNQLQQQLDIRQMMDITARELGKVLGARQARIRFDTRFSSIEDENGAAS